MDEKFGRRFWKMQNATINAKLFIFCIFLWESQVKNFLYAGFWTEFELCIPSED